MNEIPAPHWKHLGRSSNADFYEIEADVLGVVPHQDTTDNAQTARESIAFQVKHWTSRGHRGAVVVFMDFVLNQDSGARAVYAEETDDIPTTAFALVGATFFAQAAAAVFMGLAKPGVPTQIFPSLEEAQPFIREMNQTRGGKL